MTQVYDILEGVRDKLRANPNVFEVTSGDISKIDLNKTTNFPLAHLDMPNVSFVGNTIQFNLSILCLDVVDYNKKEVSSDVFNGNNNLADVLNSQLAVISDIVESVRRGSLYDDEIQIVGEPTADKIVDEYENMLAGWGLTITLSIPNRFSIC
jgi:hypothetical protein